MYYFDGARRTILTIAAPLSIILFFHLFYLYLYLKSSLKLILNKQTNATPLSSLTNCLVYLENVYNRNTITISRVQVSPQSVKLLFSVENVGHLIRLTSPKCLYLLYLHVVINSLHLAHIPIKSQVIYSCLRLLSVCFPLSSIDSVQNCIRATQSKLSINSVRTVMRFSRMFLL